MKGMTDERLKSLFLESRRHFDVALERIDRNVATLVESVSSLDGKFDRKFDEATTSTQRDRRIRSLEDAVVDLQQRVVRLESGTDSISE
jgi:predicted RNase H-like nuclease (RuvC/YqgF family)